MRGDVAERLVEPGDAVRHADQIGMQADRHDSAGLGALGVKRVELAFDRRDELIDRTVAGVEERRIVDLEGIRDRDEPLPPPISMKNGWSSLTQSATYRQPSSAR